MARIIKSNTIGIKGKYKLCILPKNSKFNIIVAMKNKKIWIKNEENTDEPSVDWKSVDW